MRPLEKVQTEILAAARRLESETVPLADAVGRVLAAPVVASHDVPQWANSAMDGFAVRSADVAEPGAVLEILADVPAGRVADTAVGPGQAIRIMTGAPMPEGADAVIRVEDASAEGDQATIHVSAGEGLYVRPAGGDVQAGAEVFRAGTRLSPMHVGALAAVGCVEPEVSRRPRAVVLSTGDELAPPETEDLAPGMIRDANRPMLTALLDEAGADADDYRCVPDDADAFRAAIGRAAAGADAIVSSGGVSMGDYDVTKAVLGDEVGVEFMQVAQAPGKPFGFGKIAGALFFGLPGNPVSALVAFESLVRPALLAMQGAAALFRPRVAGVAGRRLTGDLAKTVYLRVGVEERDGVWSAAPTGSQASNVLSAAAAADAFAVLPRGVGAVDEGESVTLELLRSAETGAEIRDG